MGVIDRIVGLGDIRRVYGVTLFSRR